MLFSFFLYIYIFFFWAKWCVSRVGYFCLSEICRGLTKLELPHPKSLDGATSDPQIDLGRGGSCVELNALELRLSCSSSTSTQCKKIEPMHVYCFLIFLFFVEWFSEGNWFADQSIAHSAFFLAFACVGDYFQLSFSLLSHLIIWTEWDLLLGCFLVSYLWCLWISCILLNFSTFTFSYILLLMKQYLLIGDDVGALVGS